MLEKFLAYSSYFEFLFAMIASALYGIIFSVIARRYSRSFGDRSQYYMIFSLLIPIMTLTITVVKSSLALSLGLVGALSIVRFRTPIKEPEELVYIFSAIALGLTLGAGQYVISFVALVVISLIIVVIGEYRVKREGQELNLDIEIKEAKGWGVVTNFSKELEKATINHKLLRYEENEASSYASFCINDKDTKRVSSFIGSVENGENFKLTVSNRVN